MFGIIYVYQNTSTEVYKMDYKKCIIEMLQKADVRRLKIIYAYVKAIMEKRAKD